MPLASWLFIRNEESIWIERPYGHSLIVTGPGMSRAQRDFRDEAELEAYQVEVAERLAAGGWFLWSINSDRRHGGDRRSGQRGTSDRRAPTMRES
jgi:hypothetical protein